MKTPIINYKYWLNKWNDSIGNARTYSNINIRPWSKFEGSLLECEAEILKIINKEELSDFDILNVIDLINQWGGKTSRMFYTTVKNQSKSSRELVMSNPNLSLYKEGIKLSKVNNYKAPDSFRMVNGIGPSFMGKHATFWSNFNMVIIDNKIAGTLGFKNPNKLLNSYSYQEFMNRINSIQNENDIANPVFVERGIFSFHSNYFDNENSKFKSNINDFTDLEYAIQVAELLNIDIPQYVKNNMNV